MNGRRDERITIADFLSRLDSFGLSHQRLTNSTNVLAEHHRDPFDSRARLYLTLTGKVFLFRRVYATGK
jgi:hypothetical protein